MAVGHAGCAGAGLSSDNRVLREVLVHLMQAMTLTRAKLELAGGLFQDGIAILHHGAGIPLEFRVGNSVEKFVTNF